MVDWDAMRNAVNNAGGPPPPRDIVSFLETEIMVASQENDQFLTNLYGQAIAEIKSLRDLVDALKAEVQYYQQVTRES